MLIKQEESRGTEPKLTALAIAQPIVNNRAKVRPGRAGLGGAVVDAPCKVGRRAETHGVATVAASAAALCDEVVHAGLLTRVRRVLACFSLALSLGLSSPWLLFPFAPCPCQGTSEMLQSMFVKGGEGGGTRICWKGLHHIAASCSSPELRRLR